MPLKIKKPKLPFSVLCCFGISQMENQKSEKRYKNLDLARKLKNRGI